MKRQKLTLNLKHILTEEEKRKIAIKLARANQRCSEIEEQKKRIDADLKAQLEAEKATVDCESRRFNAGHDYRDVECEVHFNYPGAGVKTIIRLDTFGVVRSERMTTAECQEELDLFPADDEAQSEVDPGPVPPPPAEAEAAASEEEPASEEVSRG